MKTGYGYSTYYSYILWPKMLVRTVLVSHDVLRANSSKKLILTFYVDNSRRIAHQSNRTKCDIHDFECEGHVRLCS